MATRGSEASGRCMITKSSFEYATKFLSQNIREDLITASLRASGWRDTDAAEIVQAAKTGSLPAGAQFAPEYAEPVITEADYPIQKVWILKQITALIWVVLISVILLYFGYYNIYFLFFIAYTPIQLIVTVLQRLNFHFSLERDTLTVRQGVLSKQQRIIHYGTTQSVIAKRDLFDRLFGLASLVIENAAQGAGKTLTATNNEQAGDSLGFSKNKISIPGLNIEDAEILKGILLRKITQNPISDSHSGL